MADWQFDESSRRYRDAASGKFVSASSERAIRDDYSARKQADIATVAGRVAAGDLAVADWERAMQRSIRELHANEFAFGRGGRRQVTEQEWQQLGAVATEQERYLRDFAAAIARGELTEKQIANRASMYGDAATTSYHRGKAATYDGLRLPAQPGDGGTACVSRCLCAWQVDETDGEWEATWVLDGGEHCDGCIARSQRWAPYIQVKPVRVAA
jgi:hypothetical protein